MAKNRSSLADVAIDLIANGPYLAQVEVEMKDPDGRSYPAEKPFCDGTHLKIGFQAAEKAVPEFAESRSLR